METRAAHLVVGGFVLVLIAGFVGFLAWFVGLGIGTETVRYRIHFTDSVAGLAVGSPVRFRGVSVGSVVAVAIDPQDVARVRVDIEVREGTPIKADSVASLRMEGVTGAGFVNITGGTQDSPPLLPREGETIAEIPSEPSTIATVMSVAPQLLASMVEIADRVQKLLSDENLESIGRTLAESARMSQSLSASAGEFELLVSEARLTLETVQTTVSDMARHGDALAARAGTAIGTIDVQSRRIGDEVATTAADLRMLIDTVNRSAERVSTFLERTEEPVSTFAGEGLYELTALMAELRQLAAGLSRLTSQIERGPGDFFFGRSGQGVRVE